MTNISAIEAKVSSIRKYFKILRNYQKYSQKEIEANLTLRGATERYLYLITQATIDLAEAIISLKNFRRPSSYTEAFYILKEENFISFGLAEKLAKMAGFRNIIAHDYENLDFGIIYDVLKNRLIDIDKFLKRVKEKLRI